MSQWAAWSAAPMSRSRLAETAVSIGAGVSALLLVVSGYASLVQVLALAAIVPVVFVVAKRPEWAVVLLFAAAAMDVKSRIATVAGVKLTVYQLLAALVLVAVLVGLKRKRLRWRSTPLDLPLAVFMGIAASSIAVAPNSLESLVDWVSLASSIFLMYAIVLLANSEDVAASIVWAALAISAVLAVLAIIERAGFYSVGGTFLRTSGYGIRPSVTFKDTNMFATLMYVAAAMAVPLLFQAGSKLRRLFGAVAVAMCLVALWATHSRGAWLAAVVASLVIVSLLRLPRKTRTIAVLALVLSVAAVGIRETAFVKENIVGASQDASAMARYDMGLAALDMAQDYPLGLGLGGYSEVYPLYRRGEVRASLVESHTAYLTLLTEVGLLGLLAYLWMLLRFARSVGSIVLKLPRGPDQALLVGSIAAVAGVATQALTYSLEGHKLLWFALGVGMAVFVRRSVRLDMEV